MTTPNTNTCKPTLRVYDIDELDELDDGSPDPDVEAFEHFQRTGTWPPGYEDAPDDDRSLWAPEGGDPRFALLSEHNFRGLGKARITHIPDGQVFPCVGAE